MCDRSREQMTKKQTKHTEIDFDRDDPPPDDFHQVNILMINKIYPPSI